MRIYESRRKALVAVLAISIMGLSMVIGILTVGADALNGGGIIYVDDDTCPAFGTGTTQNPYCSIQDAVDASSDLGEIRIAGGVYTGTQVITAVNGNKYKQVLLIDRKSLTVGGGYDGSNWLAEADPLANPTVIDADRDGRGITVLGTGSQEVTLAGMTVTGGDYTGLGDPVGQGGKICQGSSYDCGGGISVNNLILILRDMVIIDNVAGRIGQDRPTFGGGMDTRSLRAGSMIMNSQFISNTAGGDRGYGGGLHLTGSQVVIKDSLFDGNYSARSGGGLATLFGEPIIVQGTSFIDNTAASSGAAVFAVQGFCSLLENSLEINGGYLTGNDAPAGSALSFNNSNSWPGDCGAKLSNLILTHNSSIGESYKQAVIDVGNYAQDYYLELNHLTASDNDVPSFLYVRSDTINEVFTATVNNTLVATSTYGIAAEEGAGELNININNPLFFSVSEEILAAIGDPLTSISGQIVGDPLLDASYHLRSGSAAINAGINAGVMYDIDGDPRSVGLPDIGADEYIEVLFLPTILK